MNTGTRMRGCIHSVRYVGVHKEERMATDETPASAYGVVQRLMQLRDLLHAGPSDARTIAEKMPGVYDGPSGTRRLRRDLQNLKALGYRVEREGRPVRW